MRFDDGCRNMGKLHPACDKVHPKVIIKTTSRCCRSLIRTASERH